MNVMAGNLEEKGSVSDFSIAIVICYLHALCRNITVIVLMGLQCTKYVLAFIQCTSEPLHFFFYFLETTKSCLLMD